MLSYPRFPWLSSLFVAQQGLVSINMYSQKAADYNRCKFGLLSESLGLILWSHSEYYFNSWGINSSTSSVSFPFIGLTYISFSAFCWSTEIMTWFSFTQPQLFFTVSFFFSSSSSLSLSSSLQCKLEKCKFKTIQKTLFKHMRLA